MTSAPGSTPIAWSATSSETVPFATQRAWAQSWRSANARPKASARSLGSGKPPQSPSRSAAMTACSSSGPLAGHCGQGSVRTGVPAQQGEFGGGTAGAATALRYYQRANEVCVPCRVTESLA